MREDWKESERIGCEGHTHAVLWEGRFLRWRCKHPRCENAMEARELGLHCFHIRDLQTGEQWTEMEPVSLRVAGKRAA